MYCPECGRKNDDNALFCEECGTSLKEYREENISEEQPLFEEQPMYQEPMYQEPPMPRQKNPLSSITKILIAEAVLAVALFAGIFISMNKKLSPERVAEQYYRAVNECNWSDAYEYCSFPDSELLTKQMYVNAHAKLEKGAPYKNIKVRKEGVPGKTEKNTIAQNYIVEAMRAGSAAPESSRIQLVRDGKKFIFWDEWKVVPEESYAENVRFSMLDGAKLKLNGTEIKGKTVKEEGNGYNFTVPYLFCGDYQMEVKAEGMQTYRSNIKVTQEGSSEREIVLLPSEKIKQEIARQAGADLKKILESAINGKDFSAVKECFSEESLNNMDVKSDYDNLVSRLRENTYVKSFQLSDMKVSFERISAGEISLKTTVHNVKMHTSYWNDSLERSENDIRRYMTYRKEGKEWKLKGMPI